MKFKNLTVRPVVRGAVTLVTTLLLMFSVNTAFAVDGFYLPEDPQLLKRYQALSEEFRCLVCQNQNLADSNAELARDLKKELVKLLESGRTDEEIAEFLVTRYGDFVLYRPPLKNSTVVLWLAPLIGVLGIGSMILLFWRRGRRPAATSAASNDQINDALDRLRSTRSKDTSD